MKNIHLFSLLAGLFISVALLNSCKKDKEEKPLIIKQGDYAPPAWMIGDFFERDYIEDDTTKTQFRIHTIDDSCCWRYSWYRKNSKGEVSLVPNLIPNQVMHDFSNMTKWYANCRMEQEITSNSYTIREYEERYLKPDFYIHIEKVPSDDPNKPHIKVWYNNKRYGSKSTIYYRYR